MDVHMGRARKRGPGTSKGPFTTWSHSSSQPCGSPPLCAALSYSHLGERNICKNWKMSWQSQKNLASELGLVYSHSLFLSSVLLVRGLPTISDQVLSCCPSKTNKQFYYEMSTDIAFSSWIPHQGSRACWLLKAWTHSHCQPVLSALQFSTSSCSPGCASFSPKSLQSCST